MTTGTSAVSSHRAWSVQGERAIGTTYLYAIELRKRHPNPSGQGQMTETPNYRTRAMFLDSKYKRSHDFLGPYWLFCAVVISN